MGDTGPRKLFNLEQQDCADAIKKINNRKC